MRCPSWRWSRRRPATLPKCISSNVHLRFKRLLFGECTSGSMRGFGCESRAMRWVAVRSRKTVWTYGMCRSEWRVWLETYHGALVIDLRSLDWYRWMTAMLESRRLTDIYSSSTTEDIQRYFTLLLFICTPILRTVHQNADQHSNRSLLYGEKHSLINKRQHKKWSRDSTLGIHNVTCWTPDEFWFDYRQR